MTAPAPTLSTTRRPHIVWLDVMRLVAILMVVICHCTDPLNASAEARSNPDIGFWGAVWGAAVRACVPLFVMITGALLLPVRQEAGAFYKKRIPRVLWPFLIWSVLFNLAPWFIQWVGGSSALVTDFFPYAPDPSASLSDALRDVAMIPLAFTVYATPMWYIYLLVGLYLYMPIFSAWVTAASDKSKRLFLYLWGISLLLPYATYFISPNLLGICSWNGFGTFYYFAGFNGYLLLGHMLSKGNDWPTGKIALLTVPMFSIGFLITFKGFRFMTADPNLTEAGFELFFTYCSINVVMMTAAVFLLVQKGAHTLAADRRHARKPDQMRAGHLPGPLFLYRSGLSGDRSAGAPRSATGAGSRSDRFQLHLDTHLPDLQTTQSKIYRRVNMIGQQAHMVFPTESLSPDNYAVHLNTSQSLQQTKQRK